MHRQPLHSGRGSRRANHHAITARTDPAAEVALEKQKNAILDLFREGQAAQWSIGEHYNLIVDKKLAEKAGYKRARDFFAAQLKAVPQATLSSYGRVARSFSRELTVKYGMTKLSLLLRLRQLTNEGPLQGDPGPIEIEFPAADDSMQRKPFAQASTRELSRAIGHLRKPKPPADQPVPPLDLRILDALRQVIDEFYGPSFGVRIKTFVLNGAACFALLNLPVGRMNAVFDALSRAELKERDRDIPGPSPMPPGPAPFRFQALRSDAGVLHRSGRRPPRVPVPRARVEARWPPPLAAGSTHAKASRTGHGRRRVAESETRARAPLDGSPSGGPPV